MPQDLLEHRPVGAVQHQAVRRVLLQREAAVAVHRVGDVDEQRVRDGVTAVGDQRVDDLLGVVAGGAGVPQAERGEAVGVDVLGGALELGERRDGPAGGLGVGVVDLEQERLVALDDQGSVSHGLRANAARAGGVPRPGRRGGSEGGGQVARAVVEGAVAARMMMPMTPRTVRTRAMTDVIWPALTWPSPLRAPPEATISRFAPGASTGR